MQKDIKELYKAYKMAKDAKLSIGELFGEDLGINYTKDEIVESKS